MSAFADQMLLRFLQEAFVEDLLKDKLGLPALFNLTYEITDIELKEIVLAAVAHRQFQMPVFETIRTAGTEERILPPPPERIQLNRVQPRYGRLAWVDAFMEILLTTKVHDKKAPIEKITAQDLIEKLGGVASITELKTKLKTLYPESVVTAFFKELASAASRNSNAAAISFLNLSIKLLQRSIPMIRRTPALFSSMSACNSSRSLKLPRRCKQPSSAAALWKTKKNLRKLSRGERSKHLMSL